jgi:AraC-like DNA-binding protein
VGADELPPPAPLAELVLCLWRRRFPSDVPCVIQPTLPDGCIDLVSMNGGPVYVMGPETVGVSHVVSGGTDIVGLRLRPGVGARVFGGAVGELVDAGAPLLDLAGAPAVRGGTRHTLADSSPDHRPLIDALLPLIAAAGPDDGVAWGVGWLARHPAASIDDLCRHLGWSSRETRRRFTTALGFGPKVMQRMLRFQRALLLAELGYRHPHPPLGALAAAADYTDQPHMTREFRALAGATPGELLCGRFDATLHELLGSTANLPRARPGSSANSGRDD